MIRIGSWNILGRRSHQMGRSAEPGAIARALKADPVDVLCLQEVHFFGDSPELEVIDELSSVGLVNIIGEPLSPSHLDNNASLGLAIASRFPLTSKRIHQLRNPRISAQVRGKNWVLHDKGLLGATLELGHGRRLQIYSLHLFPYFEFGIEESHRYVQDMWHEFWDYVDKATRGLPLVLAGDFNHELRSSAAERWSKGDWRFCFKGSATTESGLALDDIAVNWDGGTGNRAVSATFSDHRIVVAELDLPAQDGMAPMSSPMLERRASGVRGR